jgi:hypothetical protein
VLWVVCRARPHTLRKRVGQPETPLTGPASVSRRRCLGTSWLIAPTVTLYELSQALGVMPLDLLRDEPDRTRD